MNKFGFIAHPITRPHLYEILGGIRGKMTSFIPKDILKRMLIKSPPIKFGSSRNIKSPLGITIEGEGVICSLLPDQMLILEEKFVLNKIAQGINKLKKMGARVIALGGFTSIAGDEGLELSKIFKDIALTNGNTCTAVLTIEGIIKATDILELELDQATMTIIGATGDIGSICSKIFSKKTKKLNIVARREKHLKEFADILKKYGTAEIEIFKHTSDAIKKADIVLTATSSITALIDPGLLKPGAIVCDVSLPPNVPKEILNIRNDIFVFEGGLAKLPYYRDIKGRDWNRLLPGDRAYGCLTEAILLTFENRLEHYSIGRGNITEERIQEMSNLLKKHSFELSDFFCGYKFYTEKDIENIKRAKIY